MAQYTDIMNVNLPAGYQFRYTLDHLLKVHAANTGMEIRDVISEILSLLEKAEVGMKERMFYYYRKEEMNSTRPVMNAERQAVISEYFDITADQLLSGNILSQKQRAVNQDG